MLSPKQKLSFPPIQEIEGDISTQKAHHYGSSEGFFERSSLCKNQLSKTNIFKVQHRSGFRCPSVIFFSRVLDVEAKVSVQVET